MQKLCLTIALGLAFWALGASPQGLSSATAADAEGSGAQPKCLKAEVNPVTGHVLCVEPLGAPVDPAPSCGRKPLPRESARRGRLELHAHMPTGGACRLLA